MGGNKEVTNMKILLSAKIEDMLENLDKRSDLYCSRRNELIGYLNGVYDSRAMTIDEYSDVINCMIQISDQHYKKLEAESESDAVGEK